jgi:hypothetical protein
VHKLVANLVGRIQRKKLNGRDHIVAPLTMIVPGVLAGSEGPLFYPKEEVTRNVAAWNHMPIVVYHPTANGRAVSARDSEVLNKSAVGVVLNARFEDGKLKADGWFDVAAMERIDVRVMNALTAGTPMELSTGLYVRDRDDTPGDFNGIAYNAVARDYEPDHLAVLPDQSGACSLKDGCGVLINENKREEPNMAKEKLIASLIANCDCWSEDDKEVLNAMSEEKLTQLNSHVDDVRGMKQFVSNVSTGFDNDRIKIKVNNEGQFSYLIKDDVKPDDPKPVENKESKPDPKPQTTEEWFASAPPEVQSVVRNAMAMEKEQKENLVKLITANERNKFSSEFLMTKEVPELQGIAALLPEDKPPTNPTVNYFGAATPAQPTVNNDDEDEDVLPLPTMNYESQAS